MALKRGFQVALFCLGRVPEYSQTDNLSAATHNIQGEGPRPFNEDLETERLLGRGGCRGDYRHVIWSLVRKPGAFARYRYREAFFPSLTFRRTYDALCARAGSMKERERPAAESIVAPVMAHLWQVIGKRPADGFVGVD